MPQPESIKKSLLAAKARLHGTLIVSCQNGTLCEIHLSSHDGKFIGQVQMTRTIGTNAGADDLARQGREVLKIRDALLRAMNEEATS